MSGETSRNDTPRPKRRINWASFWVMMGAFSSGGFFVLILITFLLLPPATIGYLAGIWPFLCVGYIIMQIIPMIARYQTQGLDVAIDQFTSIFAVMGTVFVLAAAIFKISLSGDGWYIFGLNIVTHAADLLLLVVGNKMIAAARGSEETPVRG
jgi:hypothetical protein